MKVYVLEQDPWIHLAKEPPPMVLGHEHWDIANKDLQLLNMMV